MLFVGIHWPNYLTINDWWGRPLLPEIFGQSSRWSKIADFRSIFARSASDVAQLAERRSLAGELTLSCARPSEDG